MTNTQTGPYPVLFAKNTTRARISLQTTVGSTHFRRSLGPGETKEVPWVIAKSSGFNRLWTEGKLEVSDKFDFETTLDELPPIGASDDPVEWEEIEGKPGEFPPADHTRSWDDIAGRPSVFPPATHTHVIGDTTGLQDALDLKVGNSDPRLSDDRDPTEHTHAITEITGLQDELDGKAASGHDHDIAGVTGLQSALNGKAPSTHTHTTAQVDGLDDALAGKVDTTDDRLTDSRTPTDHTHAWADIDDPPTIPDAAAAQADSGAEDVATLVEHFNELLGKLRDAGIIES